MVSDERLLIYICWIPNLPPKDITLHPRNHPLIF